MNKSTTHKIMINNTNQQLVVIKIDENKQNYKLVKKKDSSSPLYCLHVFSRTHHVVFSRFFFIKMSNFC